MLPTPKSGILDIAPYVGGKSTAKAGVRVVKLSSNETPLGESPNARKAYIEAATSLHRYPDGSAEKLREAIGEVYKITPKQIVCGAGSDELIGLLVHAYVDADDEIIISEHGFLMYKIYAQSVGAKTIEAPEKNLRTDVDALLAAVTAKTKIVFIANPNNPTGSYISATEMKRLRDGLPENVLLAIDDAYAEYATANDYSDGSELVNSTENTVMLRTFSKIYGLSSLRLGWMFAPTHIIDVINRIRGPFNVSTSAIMAGIAAIRDIEFTKNAIEFNEKWREWLTTEITNLGLKVYPSIANFILVDFSNPDIAKNASNHLMEQGLIVREVANYKLPNCLRITIGLEEDNKAVVAALKEFVK
ncbi:MAG: histidinol-phosphate transaminase [Rickettsiales bacterium]|jgi:histidinol-phosphate aminotransferase